ncbi:rhomboid family intramembrane serine protease [soil metagenome]
MTEPEITAPHRPLPGGLLALVLFMTGAELLLQLADTGLLVEASLRGRIYASGAFWAPLLHGAEPMFALQPVTMFISHALLHGGLVHLGLNMAVLLGLGRLIADLYGERTLLPLFLLSAIAGGGAFGLISASPIPMVGASGAVFGFLGVWSAWDWRRHREAGLSPRPVLMRGAALVLVNLLLFFGMDGMIAWEAHLGGYAAGLLVGAWLERARSVKHREGRAEARRRRSGERGDGAADPEK